MLFRQCEVTSTDKADILEEYVILTDISNSNSNNKHDENSPQIIDNKQKEAIIACIIIHDH